ncbi:MAG: DUF2971 domain-containing protein [Rhodobacteraceae bacterium]|nr:DUF2971 domain-containing protein [Paracoccaceae bacterium]
MIVDDQAFLKILFFPHLVRAGEDLKSSDHKLAYYTTAETASKIIRNGEVWLRSAQVMNDFSEIAHGMSLVENAFSTSVGKDFRNSLKHFDVDGEAVMEMILRLKGPVWKKKTYLACLSLHDPTEDKTGRLSMWRAYGDVALVVNNAPFKAVAKRPNFFSMPVQYLDQTGFNEQIAELTKRISENVARVKNFGPMVLVHTINRLLLMTAVGTKHSGFSEEKEWRIVFQPQDPEKLLQRRIETVRGIPQTIWALPLCHDPRLGLEGADIPSLLNRIIIGPTPYPRVTLKAFRHLLLETGVENPDSKLSLSDIPLRRFG